MSLKDRICVKLNVRKGPDALDIALRDHLDHTNVKSAASYLMPGHHSHRHDATSQINFPLNDLLILYTVDGVTEVDGDAKVFVLDRCTTERHRQHAAGKRPIHYVALVGQGTIPRPDLSKVSAEIPPAGDHVDVTVGVNWSESSPVKFICLDANPSMAVLPSSSHANQLLSRSSLGLTEAIAASEAAERGVANVDYEGAMTHCCGWLAETIDACESQFVSAESSADSTLGIVEAFLQRNTTLQKTRDFISTDPNVFTRIERALHATSPALQRWVQKKAALDCLAESTRLCATWIAMLSGHAMSLRIRNPATTQSLDSTNATMRSIADALIVALASFPGQNISESDQFSHYIQQRVVPQITSDLVLQVEKLLSLTTIFSVGTDSIPVTPVCTSEGLQSHFINSSWAFRSWLYEWHQIVAALNNTFPSRLTEMTLSSGQAAAYSSERCERLRDMLFKCNRASLGIMSTEVAALYTTLHRAANAFPLLRVAEADNWMKLEDSFNKSLALKFTSPEPIQYDPPRPDAPSPISPFSPLLSQVSANQSTMRTSCLNQTQATFNGSMLGGNSSISMLMNGSALVEEREVLSSRVTIMGQELAEARMLIASLQSQLQRANGALVAAQELNVYMMAELRKAQLGHTQAGTELPVPQGSREALVQRLAREEHARRESGRQIEDEELDD